MQPTNNMSSHSARISRVEVELGFVGDGKVFVKVEKQEDNSEKLMIYEAKNAFTGFFLNLFRDRKTTFTAREWAAKSQEKMPAKIDKERLIQNIKTAVSPSCVERAPQMLSKLVDEKKLDAAANEISKSIQDIPLSKVACKGSIDASVRQLQSNLKSSLYRLNLDGLTKYTNDLGLKLTPLQITALFGFLSLAADDSKFGEKAITQALLSHLDIGEEKQPWVKEELQGFVELLIAMESTLKVTTPSPEQVRYLNTLKRIEENLNKQSNPAAVINAS
jgi:hypothetical protein